MEKYIWDFLPSKTYLKELLDPQKERTMLDLGCRHGNSLFHAYHEFGFMDCRGIDLSSLEYAVSDEFFFNTYHGKLAKGVDEFLNEHHSPEQVLFDYYQLIMKEIIGKPGVNSIEGLKDTFRLTYEKDLEDYLSEDLDTEPYDLVILGKVLHFHSVKNPQGAIVKALNYIKENGILFIKTWIKTYPDGRRRDISMEELISWLNGMQVLEVIQEGELAYIFIKN